MPNKNNKHKKKVVTTEVAERYATQRKENEQTLANNDYIKEKVFKQLILLSLFFLHVLCASVVQILGF